MRGTTPQRHPWYALSKRHQVTTNHGLGASRVLVFDVTPHIPSLDRDGRRVR